MKERVDTLMLKQELAATLGSARASQYFTGLRRVLSDASKTANVAGIGIVLNPYETALHNRLVLAVLANATRTTPPPPVSTTATIHGSATKNPKDILVSNTSNNSSNNNNNKDAKRDPTIPPTRPRHAHLINKLHASLSAVSLARQAIANSGSAAELPPKRSKPANAIKTLQSLDDNTLALLTSVNKTFSTSSVIKKANLSRSIPQRFINHLQHIRDPDANLPASLTPEIQARVQMLQTCRQSSTLPSVEALQSRMQIVCALNGVELDNDCVMFMQQALSTYLKDIVASVQQRVRHGNLLQSDIFTGAVANGKAQLGISDGVFKPTQRKTDKVNPLQTQDLMLSSVITPSLLRRSVASVDAMELLLSLN
ncbi:hypothetical protein HK100_003172 [Physocladia obscura]|uniref:Uncharacterized protein n=1 Tax=Physocladia obscura TaxID=109957 RepID=A0AAD5XEV8_9FUNG|nr:hypothetical protein HK100_003172 [Physocladia obscura]